MRSKKDMLPPLGKERQDESIMGTNNSSIVSKHSVERLYYPNEHYFQYFVKKPQKRSPTINRGYWLRMQALEYVVHKFLEEPTKERKILVNLGCGYDPLPFQCLAKTPEKCHNIKFVDVDYMKLITRKCAVVVETEPLRRLLSGVELPASHSNVVLRSDQYLAFGCDLIELEELERILADEVDIKNCLVLFAAEVSVTYMEIEAADALIKWAAKFQSSRFCLIEQFLPDGPENPFAETMLRHFEKFSTPLRPIHKYPLMKDQQQRFRDAGWPLAVAHDLWKLWSMPGFLAASQRTSLDAIEPFDEWEEFSLFASHYFLLFAGKGVPLGKDEVYGALLQEDPSPDKILNNQETKNIAQVAFHGSAKHQGCRRFAAAAPLTSQTVTYHGGLGTKTRLNSSDLILHDVNANTKIPSSLPGLRPRMCHTVTCLEEGRFLLVGGRASPDNALADCWIYDSPTDKWQRTEDIAPPRYRHCAVELPNSQVLVFGGRTSHGGVLNDCLVWAQNSGWKPVYIQGDIPPPCFGAATIAAASSGIFVGGMTAEKAVLEGYWEWVYEMSTEGAFIKFQNTSSQFRDVIGAENPFCRFGASLAWSPLRSGLLLIGGIHGTGMLRKDNEILFIDTTNYSVATLNLGFGARRPLLIGCSVVSTAEAVMVIGGGAVCFSFGTFWNDGFWTLSATGRDQSSWGFQEKAVDPSSSDLKLVASLPTTPYVQRISINSSQDFEDILNKAQPAILNGLDIGACTRNWSFAYLKERIGAGRKIIVHKAEREHMDFQTKNFSYVSQNFGDFLDAVEEGQKLYLRSVSSEEPASKPAELSRDFPEISEDFNLPPELDFVTQNVHSSPLRISGPVVMWLHYDVMANVLCQVRGSKRLVLYPPGDVSHLCFAPGASSSSLNVFETTPETYPPLAHTHPHEVVLHAGDILFIPALWFHTASPIDGVSISVNTFFRNFKSGYAVGRDIYGNRDLQPYERGRLSLSRVVKSFEQLPVEAGRFYLKRLADELMQKADAFGVSGSVGG